MVFSRLEVFVPKNSVVLGVKTFGSIGSHWGFLGISWARSGNNSIPFGAPVEATWYHLGLKAVAPDILHSCSFGHDFFGQLWVEWHPGRVLAAL